MTQSRTKGKRAELEAAKDVGQLLGVLFHRTQQFNGKGAGDIEPMNGPYTVHWEVKHYKAGLSWWVKRSADTALLVAGELCYCRLNHLPGILRRNYLAYSSVTCGFAERWMAQAVRDAKADQVPVVVCRQDRSPWLVVWRREDTERMIDAMNGIANATV
jgi:hypothetical protein